MPFPTDLASELLERLGVHGKPDLAQIATRIGLRVREVDAQGFEGTIVRALDGAKGIIAVKKSIREYTRKRFTIAHEIGHYIIPSHRKLQNVCTSDVIESWKKGLGGPEIEANEFAAELLLPARLVREPFRLRDPSLHTIRLVASLFETSLTATTCRFVSLTDLPCAAVWSEGKRMKWYKRSGTFPFCLPTESLPCEGSFAYTLFEGGETPNDLAPVSADSWLDRKDVDKVARALEHSIRMPSYDAVLTLILFDLRDSGSDEDPPPLEDLDPEDFTLHRKRWPK